MAVIRAARKLTNRKRYFHLLVTTAGIDRAVRGFARRFGADFSELRVEEMSLYERYWVAEALAQIGFARHRLGLTPLEPLEPDYQFDNTSLPIPFLTAGECSALSALLEAGVDEPS